MTSSFAHMIEKSKKYPKQPEDKNKTPFRLNEKDARNLAKSRFRAFLVFFYCFF